MRDHTCQALALAGWPSYPQEQSAHEIAPVPENRCREGQKVAWGMTRAEVWGLKPFGILDKDHIITLVFRANQVRSQLLTGENDLHIVRKALN
jgi:hypothetical protein